MTNDFFYPRIHNPRLPNQTAHVRMRGTLTPVKISMHQVFKRSSRTTLPAICLLGLLCSGYLCVDFASPAIAKRTLRVMTYNIHVGVGMDKKLDLKRIADVINDQHPDLVGLQEVDRGVKRTQGIDEIAELARLTRMQFVFAHNLDYQGGQYGVAILSRFPILTTDHRKYENKRE